MGRAVPQLEPPDMDEDDEVLRELRDQQQRLRAQMHYNNAILQRLVLAMEAAAALAPLERSVRDAEQRIVEAHARLVYARRKGRPASQQSLANAQQALHQWQEAVQRLQRARQSTGIKSTVGTTLAASGVQAALSSRQPHVVAGGSPGTGLAGSAPAAPTAAPAVPKRRRPAAPRRQPRPPTTVTTAAPSHSG